MFFDRHDAGERLARRLSFYKGKKAVVYALPRGGVLLGLDVAKELGVPLDVVIARKVGHPFNNEYALCAVTEDGERICDESGLCGIDEAWVDLESDIQQREARRRRIVYKKNRRTISAKGKVAILVDDGIATGLTMKAAIRAIQKQKPSSIVVAVPVASHTVIVELKKLVDDVVVLEDVASFTGAVGAYYTQFPQVSDEEVIACLNEIRDLFSKRTKRVTLQNLMRQHIKVLV
jgi:putative phosphoribosyl transferase